MNAYLAIALGSAIGGVARYGVAILLTNLMGPAFPWGTLTVNVVGSWFIGFFNTLTEPDGRLFVSSRTRQFVMIGLCGGYTTFSAFSLETLRLWQSGAALSAIAYVVASVLLCLVFVWLGHLLASIMNRVRV